MGPEITSHPNTHKPGAAIPSPAPPAPPDLPNPLLKEDARSSGSTGVIAQGISTAGSQHSRFPAWAEQLRLQTLIHGKVLEVEFSQLRLRQHLQPQHSTGLPGTAKIPPKQGWLKKSLQE